MKSLLAEFKEFINRGNVIDMAVGIIIGAAFTAIVTSLTDDIINPLIKLITGGNGTDVAGLTIPVAGTENGIDFGAFISAIINFLIVAWVVFMIVKAFNKMKDGTAKLPFMKNAKGEEVPLLPGRDQRGRHPLPPLHRRAARPSRGDHRGREEVRRRSLRALASRVVSAWKTTGSVVATPAFPSFEKCDLGKC